MHIIACRKWCTQENVNRNSSSEDRFLIFLTASMLSWIMAKLLLFKYALFLVEVIDCTFCIWTIFENNKCYFFSQAFLKNLNQFPWNIFSMSCAEYPLVVSKPCSFCKSAIVSRSVGVCSVPKQPSKSLPIAICLALPAIWHIWS